MEVSTSKGGISEDQLKRFADKVKACLHSHRSNVLAMDTAISAQSDSVKILIQMVSDLQRTQDFEHKHLEKGPLENGQCLISNIQKTIELQCSSLYGSFKVLDNCICDILKPCVPGYETSSDTERQPDETSVAEFKLDESSKYLVDLQAENKTLLKKLKENEEVKKQLQGENEHLSLELEHVQDTVTRKTDEIKKLQRQNDEYEKKERTRYSIEQQINRSENDRRLLEQKVKELMGTVRGLENEKRRMMERIVSDMGMTTSKEGISDDQLRRIADKVKACLHYHRSNVHAMDTAMSAQSDSVKMLLKMVSELQTTQDFEHDKLEKGPLENGQNLLSKIQTTLELQCSSLDGSFRVLDNCIRDILQPYVPGYETLSDTERRPYETPGAEFKPDESSQYLVDLQAENKTLHEKCKEYETAIQHLQVSNERIKLELKRTMDTVTWKTDEIQKLQRQNDEYERKAKARNLIEQKLYTTEKEKKVLGEKVKKLEGIVRGLENEKQRMMERKVSVPVQIYYQRKDELMSAVVEELSTMLNTWMQAKDMQLEILRCVDSSDIQPDKPTLVLCINASRLGTDAGSAIERVQRSGRIALLIFHHKKVHALPNHPSDRMLTSSEFKALGGIFDLAFLSGQGIYPCDMNNVAVSGIENFIRQHIAR